MDDTIDSYPFYSVREVINNSSDDGSGNGSGRIDEISCLFTKKEALVRFLKENNNNNSKNLEYSGFHSVDKALAYMNKQVVVEEGEEEVICNSTSNNNSNSNNDDTTEADGNEISAAEKTTTTTLLEMMKQTASKTINNMIQKKKQVQEEEGMTTSSNDKKRKKQQQQDEDKDKDKDKEENRSDDEDESTSIATRKKQRTTNNYNDDDVSSSPNNININKNNNNNYEDDDNSKNVDLMKTKQNQLISSPKYKRTGVIDKNESSSSSSKKKKKTTIKKKKKKIKKKIIILEQQDEQQQQQQDTKKGKELIRRNKPWEEMFLKLLQYRDTHNGSFPSLRQQQQSQTQAQAQQAQSQQKHHPTADTAAAAAAAVVVDVDTVADAAADTTLLDESSVAPSTRKGWTIGETNVASALLDQAAALGGIHVIDRSKLSSSPPDEEESSERKNNTPPLPLQQHQDDDCNDSDDMEELDKLMKWMKRQQLYYKWYKDENKGPYITFHNNLQRLEDISFDFGYISWKERFHQLQQIKLKFDDYQKNNKSQISSEPPKIDGRKLRWLNHRKKQQQQKQQQSATTTTTVTTTSQDITFEAIITVISCGGSSISSSSADPRGDNDDDEDATRNENNRINEAIRSMDIDDLDHNNYEGLDVWFLEQKNQCRSFLTGHKCTLSKEQMEDLFALKLDAFNPITLLQPKKHKNKQHQQQQQLSSLNKKEELKAKRTAERIRKEEEKAKYDEEHWERMFQELVTNYQQYGIQFLPKNASPELLKWALHVRAAYREREKELALRALRTSNQQPLPLEVAQQASPNPNDCKYTTAQRLLTPERIQRLHVLGFTFRLYARPQRISFEEFVEHLKVFKKIHGHCRVPKSYSVPGLGGWVAKQRWTYNKYYVDRNLNPEDVTSDIDLDDDDDDDGDDGEDGDDDDDNVDNDQGGNGVGEIDTNNNNNNNTKPKKKKKKCYLTPERFRILDEMGFAWTNGKRIDPKSRKTWDERFQELIEYQRLHGTTVVPQTHPTLGKWVQAQRKYYQWMLDGKPTQMKPEQAVKLEGIGFVFRLKQRRRTKEQLGRDPRLQQQRQRHGDSDTDNDSYGV